jgi:membrane protein DedA with SNARE-associated domain
MSVLLLEILGSLIRAGAALLSGYLITHHILTAAHGDQFTSEVTTHLMLALPILGALAWSIWQKYGQRTKLGAAIDTIAAMTAAQKRTGV